MKRTTRSASSRKAARRTPRRRRPARAKADRCDWCCCGECNLVRPEFAVWS